MTRYKHRMDTMDGPIEWEDDTPDPPEKTPEEKAEELDRMYPRLENTNKASYLRYKCHYCTEEFFLISPYRSRGMNPYNEGFMVKPEKSRNKSVIFACRHCLLDIHNRRESVWIGSELSYKECQI